MLRDTEIEVGRRLEPVDRAEVTIVVDNFVDLLMAGAEDVGGIAPGTSAPRATRRGARLLGTRDGRVANGRAKLASL